MMSIKLGIVGGGRVTEQCHLPALRNVPEFEVAALADLNGNRLQAVADRFQIAQRYADPQELMADPALDAVAICTPVGSHCALALGALAAGKHVLVEKPLALTVSEGEQMVRAAEASGKVAATGFNLRCHRLVRRAREVIATGGLGKIHQIVTAWGSPTHLDPDLPEWRRAAATGGGALIEIGVHHLDACAFLLGDQFESVQMLSRSGACEEESVSLLGRTRGQVLISSTFSQVTAQLNEFRIFGLEGALSFSLYHSDSFIFSHRTRPQFGWSAQWERLRQLQNLPEMLRIARSGGDYVLSYVDEWNRFASAIRGDAAPASSLADGLAALRVVQAAIASRESGAAVRIKNSEA